MFKVKEFEKINCDYMIDETGFNKCEEKVTKVIIMEDTGAEYYYCSNHCIEACQIIIEMGYLTKLI